MAFETSPPYIYENMKLGGDILDMSKRDWIGIFSGLHSSGFHWDPISKTLKQLAGFPVLQANTPWCHAASSPGKHCALDHNITFNNWRIIHPRCMECWKVCMTIENYDHLRQIEKLQLEQHKSAKCGIEMRDYTPKHYGAYWYTDSIDAGKERYYEVYNDIKSAFGQKYADDNIILKRACTEFEMVKGPSPFWHNTRDEESFLELIESFVVVPRNNTDQNEMIKDHVRLRWTLWAHANGDFSYVPYNGGSKLFPGYVTYHEAELDDYKHDIALARAMAKGGIESTDGADFVALAEKFKDERGLPNLAAMSYLLGADKNNLNMERGATLKEVPDELKTEINS